MTVYRQIQISYWQDSFILKLTPEEKFFYLYLLTNSKTKQCGIYELPLQIIGIETGYNRETVIKLIQRFIEHRKIRYDWESEEIFLLNWVKHNPFDNNPKVKKCVEKELQSVHNPNMIPEDSPLIPLTRGIQGASQKEKEEEKEYKKKINVGGRMLLEEEYFLNLLPIDLEPEKILAWADWVDFRKDVKKKLVKTSAKKQIDFLLKQPDFIGCINQSIKNQWQGLFEVKNGTNKSSVGASPEFLAGLVADRFKKERS